VPLIVVNGSHYDEEALKYWAARPDVRMFQLEEGDQAKARYLARKQVDTEFFASIDDDDIFLPGAMSARLAPMRADRSVDLVVGNGIIERDGVESIVLARLDLHRRDPLIGLAAENWMPSSCAATFRTDAIGPGYFERLSRWMEWTALAFQLAVDGRKIVFLDDLTYRIADTASSLSKGIDYALGAPETLRQLLQNPLPGEAQTVWRRKYGAALHALAGLHLSRGEARSAWKAHIGSLFCDGGGRYVLYSRKLVPHLLSALREGRA